MSAYDTSVWHTRGCGELYAGTTAYYTDPNGEESGIYQIERRVSIDADDMWADEFDITRVAADGSTETHYDVERWCLEALYPVEQPKVAAA